MLCSPQCKINWYFVINTSRKRHAIELSLFRWRYARWRHWNCGYNHQSFACLRCTDALCSAALVPKFMTLKSGMKAQVSLETWSSGLKPMRLNQRMRAISSRCRQNNEKDTNYEPELLRGKSHNWTLDPLSIEISVGRDPVQVLWSDCPRLGLPWFALINIKTKQL